MRVRRHIRLCRDCGERKNCPYRWGRARICRRCANRHWYPTAACPRCGRTRLLRSRMGDQQICMGCWQRECRKSGVCRQCGALTPLRRGLCSREYQRRKHDAFRRAYCATCRQIRPHVPGSGCEICADRRRCRQRLARRLSALLGEGGGEHPQVQRLYAYLTERAARGIERWLRRLDPEVRAYLAAVRRGAPITKPDVEALVGRSGGRHLLRWCRYARVFPPQPDFEGIERRIRSASADLPTELALAFEQFWRFYLRPLVEGHRYRGGDPRLLNHRTMVGVIADLLRYLAAKERSITALSQGDIDAYLNARPPSSAYFVAQFCRWLVHSRQVRRPLSAPKPPERWRVGCSRAAYFTALHAARTAEQLPLVVRIALLFVTLCAQPLTRCVALRKGAVRRCGAEVTVCFAPDAVWRFEGSEAALILRWAASGSEWLFVGKRAFRGVISVEGLRQCIHRAGILVDLGQLRLAALRELLEDCEPAEAVRMLGTARTNAGRWRQCFGARSRLLRAALCTE